MSTDSAVHDEKPDDQPQELKRVLGPKLLLLFIVGDILGAGVYAVTGDIAGEVGGIAWLPFLVAFAVATLTAFSYLELVTKYPQAAGAALYAHKAFGLHFVTFLVAFTVVCSGITSASTSSNLLAANLLVGLDATIGGVPTGDGATAARGAGVHGAAGVINLRGVGESVKFNVVLTLVEITALAIVIPIGFYVMATKGADPGQLVVFDSANDRGMFAAVTVATAIAFFSMVGFEDSVNMVEETKEPERIFPRTMLTGLGIAVVIYMLVAVSVVMVIPIGDIQSFDGETGILIEVVKTGAPDFPVDTVFPFLTVFAVANTALINMLMASRLIYGMARQDVLPRSPGQGAARPSYAVGGDRLHHRARSRPDHRGHRSTPRARSSGARRHDGPAAARGLHDRQRRLPGAAPDPAPTRFRAPTVIPVLGARRLRLPRRAVGPRPRGLGAVQDRRRPARDRHRAVGADLVHQPRHPGQEDRLPRRRAPRRLTVQPQSVPVAGPSRRPAAVPGVTRVCDPVRDRAGARPGRGVGAATSSSFASCRLRLHCRCAASAVAPAARGAARCCAGHPTSWRASA